VARLCPNGERLFDHVAHDDKSPALKTGVAAPEQFRREMRRRGLPSNSDLIDHGGFSRIFTCNTAGLVICVFHTSGIPDNPLREGRALGQRITRFSQRTNCAKWLCSGIAGRAKSGPQSDDCHCGCKSIGLDWRHASRKLLAKIWWKVIKFHVR